VQYIAQRAYGWSVVPAVAACGSSPPRPLDMAHPRTRGSQRRPAPYPLTSGTGASGLPANINHCRGSADVDTPSSRCGRIARSPI
jgi:hypothetical protein